LPTRYGVSSSPRKSRWGVDRPFVLEWIQHKQHFRPILWLDFAKKR
jgi:hypothetical protein